VNYKAGDRSEQKMKSKTVSIVLSLVMIASLSVPISQNVGEPSSNSVGAVGLVLSNISTPNPQNVGQSGPSPSGTGGLADSPWPMFRQNLNHTGVSPYDTSTNNGQLKWSFTTGKGLYSPPAIDSDGTIYVGSTDNKLYAIHPNGFEKWNFTTEHSVIISPAIGSDFTIYTGSSDNKFYAINPDGTKKWSFTTGDAVHSSPAITFDGTIYFGSDDNNLYALNPDGTKKWSYTIGNYFVHSSPAIGSDGTIYIGSSDYKLYAIYPNGVLKWSFNTGDKISSSPAISSDGTIYVGSNDNKLHAFYPNGALKWSFMTGDNVYSSPAIGSDGTIYIGSTDNRLYAINPDGTEKWRFTTGGALESSPIIGNDGTIYIGSYDGNLYAINPDGTEKWVFATGSIRYPSSPAIGSDGTIYIGSADGKLYAIGNPTLDVNVVSHFSELNSAAQSLITVHVTDGTNPVQGATVNLASDKGGMFSSQNGITDINGNFRSIFNAPTVTTQMICRISAQASKTGYATGSGYADVTINPIPWPMFRQNLNHTGVSPYDTSSNPGKLKWRFPTGDYVDSSPVIGSDGTIYVGSKDNYLYAIYPNGSKKWSFFTGNGIISCPTIGSDRTIYIGSDDDKLYAINPDGTEKWNFTTGSDLHSSPVIGSDGTIYIGSDNDKMHAINPDGTEKWNFTTGFFVHSTPAIGFDGTIYVGSRDKKFYAINPDGTEKWNFFIGGVVDSSAAIGFDGTIYVGSIDNKLHAFYPNGSKKWSFTTGGGIVSSPAIATDSTIYVGSIDKKIYAINPDGSQKWNFTTGSYVYSSPAIGSDGTIFIGSKDFKLYAINPNGIQKWNFTTDSNIWHSSPAIDSDGTIYIGSFDNYLYAIGGPGQPPIADAGPNQTVNEGDVVKFDGSGSVGGGGSVRRNADVVLMLDDSSSMFGTSLEYLKIAAKNFVGRMLPDDRVAIYSFDLNTPEQDQPFVRLGDDDVFGSGKTGYEYTSYTIDALTADSNTPLWDTCYEAINYAHTNKQNFPVVIVMTDGDDWGSVSRETGSDTYCPGALSTDTTSTWHHLDGDCKWGISRYYDEVTRYYSNSDNTLDISQMRTGLIYNPILVYTIGLGVDPHDVDYVNGAPNPPLDGNGNRRHTEYDLWNLANSSEGTGKYYHAPDSSELVDIYKNIYKEMESKITAQIVSYEWDFESDGTYDYVETINNAIDGAFDGRTNHPYGDDGVYKVTLKVTDDQNLTDTDVCYITVQNVDPTVIIESITMDVEIGLRIAGRKYNNVSMTLYEDGNPIGNVSIERMPGSPDEQMAWIPVSINFSKPYNATVTYTPEDPPNVGGNPVWIYIKSQNGSIKKIHHTFNVQQSKKRDSEHWNHVEPWEVDLNGHFIGLPFEITSHITDPGSDDLNLTFAYGSQTVTVTYLNNPPNPDPYPSPGVNPRDIVMLHVEDDDSGFDEKTLDIT